MPKRKSGEIENLSRTRKWQILRSRRNATDGYNQPSVENVLQLTVSDISQPSESGPPDVDFEEPLDDAEEQRIAPMLIEPYADISHSAASGPPNVDFEQTPDDADEQRTASLPMEPYATGTNSPASVNINSERMLDAAGEESPTDDASEGDPEEGQNEDLEGGQSEDDLEEGQREDDLEEDESEPEEADFVERGPGCIDRGDSPLYAGATMTLGESLLAILSLIFVHRLTGSCLADILQLISMHLPKANNLFKDTLFKFRHAFASLKSPVVRHFYCEKCFVSLQDEGSPCDCESRKDAAYFIEIPIIEQLRSLFLRKEFCTDLRYRFNRAKKDQDNYEDIMDGELYKKLSRPGGFLAQENAISFTWYSDGVPAFKSKKYSVWPVYLLINELPYSKRVLQQNIIVAGLWFGSSDPQVNLFLKPLHDTFQRLLTGVQVRPFGVEAPITVKGLLLAGMADTPARCDFMNHVRFNGDYGCLKCFAKGCNIKGADFGNTHVYPFSGDASRRTRKTTETHALEAVEKGEAVFGVKGTSILSKIMPDCVKGLSIDVMHCVFLGLMKRLLLLWFDSKLRFEPFSFYRHLKIVDKRITSMRPPSYIQRLPRSISQHLSYWKASEFKTFFFYLSLPVLQDIMSDERSLPYFEHFQKLVCAITLLCAESVSATMIKNAEKLLLDFVSQFEGLYGSRYMSINVHMLLHLPSVVRELGPLWVTSCFPMEDLNGKLIKMVHGTRYVGLQLYSSVAHGMILPFLVAQLPDSEAKTFSARLLSKQRREKLTKIIGNFSVVGNLFVRTKLSDNIKNLIDAAEIRYKKIQFFYRLRRSRQVFSSSDYARSQTKCSYCVCFTNDAQEKCFGLITVFLCLCNCNERICAEDCEKRFVAVIKKGIFEPCFSTTASDGSLLGISFVGRYTCTDECVLVPAERLLNVCFYIKIDNVTFIAQSVNTIEFE